MQSNLAEQTDRPRIHRADFWRQEMAVKPKEPVQKGEKDHESER